MKRKITIDDIAQLFLTALTGTEKQREAATKLLALIYPAEYLLDE